MLSDNNTNKTNNELTRRQARWWALLMLFILPMPTMWVWYAFAYLHWRDEQIHRSHHYLIFCLISYMLLAATNIAPGYPVTVFEIEYFDPLWYLKYLYELSTHFDLAYWSKLSLAHFKSLNDWLGTGGFFMLIFYFLCQRDIIIEADIADFEARLKNKRTYQEHRPR